MSGTTAKKSQDLNLGVAVDTKWFTQGLSAKSKPIQADSGITLSPDGWRRICREAPLEPKTMEVLSLNTGTTLSGQTNTYHGYPTKLAQPSKTTLHYEKNAAIGHVHDQRTKLSQHTSSASKHRAFGSEVAWARHPGDAPLATSSVGSSPSQNDGSDLGGLSEPANVWEWRQHIIMPDLTDDPAKTKFRNPESCEYDVDPETGKLGPKVDYPKTKRVDEPGLDPALAYKKNNATSELHIQRERKCREGIARKIRIQQELERERERALTREPEPEWPSTDCTLRPAAAEHFQQIADIINLEARQETFSYVLDSKTIEVRDVRRVFEYCQRNLRPFIVACLEEEDLLDRSKWPGVSEREYLEYVRFKKSQLQKPPMVVGFAFVVEPRIGFLNGPCPGSRFAGQVRLIVHSEHRQKQYGTALFDRILLSVAPYHHSLIDYKWRCVDPGMVYEQPTAAHNRRLYSRILVELFSHKNAKEKWRQKFLEKFGFKQVACLEDMIRTDKGRDSQWLDLELWQLRTHTTVHDDAPGEYLKPIVL